MNKKEIARLEANVSKLREKSLKEIKENKKKLEKKMSRKIVKKILKFIKEMYKNKIIIEAIDVQKIDRKIDIFFNIQEDDLVSRCNSVNIKNLKNMSNKAKEILHDILKILEKVEKIEEYEIRKKIYFYISDTFNHFEDYYSSYKYVNEKQLPPSDRKEQRQIFLIKFL